MNTTKTLSPIFSKKSYGKFTLSADQTANLSAGEEIRFDTVEGDITLSSYQMALKANTRYTGVCDLRIYNASGSIDFGWYNVTDSEFIGTDGVAMSSNFGSAYSGGVSANFIITTTKDIIVEVRVIGNNNSPYVQEGYSYAYIESLEAVIPVNQIPVSTINGVETEIKTKYFTGATDASATKNVAHGISDISKILHVSVHFYDSTLSGYLFQSIFYSNVSAEQMYGYYDATNIVLNGLGASLQSQAYRIKIEYYE
jgi:hypothetical protein